MSFYQFRIVVSTEANVKFNASKYEIRHRIMPFSNYVHRKFYENIYMIDRILIKSLHSYLIIILVIIDFFLFFRLIIVFCKRKFNIILRLFFDFRARL